jgi:hypothetical protein
MRAEPLLRLVLSDERITRRLSDPEARTLIEWLVDQVERAQANARSPEAARAQVVALQRRARVIGHFVSLWCHEADPSGAMQLAAVERFAWPLPPEAIDPCELMTSILAWESRQPLAVAAA